MFGQRHRYNSLGYIVRHYYIKVMNSNPCCSNHHLQKVVSYYYYAGQLQAQSNITDALLQSFVLLPYTVLDT